MFCNNCGTELEDGVLFCPKCGTRVEDNISNTGNTANTGNTGNTAYMNDAMTYVAPGSKKNTLIGMIAVGLVALVAIVFLASVFGGRSYKTVVKHAVKDVCTMDKKSMKDLISLFPKEVIDTVIKNEGLKNKNELVDMMMDEIKGTELLFGKLDNVSTKITDTEDFSEEDLQDVKEDFEDMGVKLKKKIKAGKHVTAEITFKIDGLGEDSTPMTFDVIKLGHKWYLADTGML